MCLQLGYIFQHHVCRRVNLGVHLTRGVAGRGAGGMGVRRTDVVVEAYEGAGELCMEGGSRLVFLISIWWWWALGRMLCGV